MRLAETLDLGAASVLKDALAGEQGRAIELDASAVERLGGLCLQVLLAAKTAWAAAGHSFTVTSPSPAFQNALKLMGASEQFQAGSVA